MVLAVRSDLWRGCRLCHLGLLVRWRIPGFECLLLPLQSPFHDLYYLRWSCANLHSGTSACGIWPSKRGPNNSNSPREPRGSLHRHHEATVNARAGEASNSYSVIRGFNRSSNLQPRINILLETKIWPRLGIDWYIPDRHDGFVDYKTFKFRRKKNTKVADMKCHNHEHVIDFLAWIVKKIVVWNIEFTLVPISNGKLITKRLSKCFPRELSKKFGQSTLVETTIIIKCIICYLETELSPIFIWSLRSIKLNDVELFRLKKREARDNLVMYKSSISV